MTGTIYLASISTLLIACCYWKRANNWGAAAAIIVGAVIPIACLVSEQLLDLSPPSVGPVAVELGHRRVPCRRGRDDRRIGPEVMVEGTVPIFVAGRHKNGTVPLRPAGRRIRRPGLADRKRG